MSYSREVEREIQKLWSRDPAAYYREKERFLLQHKGADSVVFHTESGALLKVEYLFKPTQVYMEREQLLAAMGVLYSKEEGEP